MVKLMAEESENTFERFYQYVDKQSEKGKIPKSPKLMAQYLNDLIELLFDEDSIEKTECSQHEGASWTNITFKYKILYPMNGFLQSNSANRVVTKQGTAILTYWKDEERHTLAFDSIETL
jgi:hypothetical protein